MSTDESFAAFVTARSGRLIAHAELLCGSREQARDIVQTVLMRAYPRWRRIEHEDPYGYLCVAVTNAVTDWWRLAHRRREQPVGVLPETAAGDGTARADDRNTLIPALARLTPRERAIVVLRYLDDRKESEVADMLGISTGTVKSLCHRALGKMRITLGEVEVERSA
ncbi:SigE family RNA polymerase sigma factor [Actinoplanes sichuanensis]|uniref:SigE family RNA polymerase sigma factor n=1 Tax=Actinoplanes sichuanensis TaxID=512349 RepID=A0ABW4A9F9_9ACTN|nr:SigE family RNA polymerase sigma factor [Actinoplanes sichuanensis]BEL09177.1 SigE family RNA polymerase sigma factor [Actinoplanes sichuanensis]